MQDYSHYFKDKKITVMGLGLLGRGVGDAAFLAECGAEVTVTDLKTEEQLKDSLEHLKDFKNITFALGGHKEEDFENRDLVLVAAGVSMDSEFLLHAKENNVPLVQSAALFAKIAGIPVIGVTGTRGKSTVTHMIHHVLTHATEGGNVILGGNVRGVSNLQLLKKVAEDSLAVFELDSWQLQGFGWSRISPQIAVFTNFMEDHMNYYHNDMGAYFADKANIFLFQEDTDVLVTTPEIFEFTKAFAQGKGVTLGQEVVLADESVLPESYKLKVPGKHNRLNAALALEALKATSLPEEIALKHLATFPGVPGRLEFLKEINGVEIYNDNNATTPTATCAGLEALGNDKNIVLIMGGADKGLDMDCLLKSAKKYCKKVILIPGTGTDRIKDVMEAEVVSSLEEAVKITMDTAKRGDIILFSPAFASFGLFKNEYDRNDKFVGAVAELKSATS